MNLFQALLLGLLGWMSSIYSPVLIGGLAGWYTLGRPLISGFVIGIILGDVTQGIILGAAIQALYIGLVTPGGSMPADVNFAAWIGIPLAMVANVGTEYALTLAVPLSFLGVAVTYTVIALNIGFVHRQDALPENGAKHVGKIQLGAVGGNGIAVFSLPGWLLNQVQLLDVPGNRGLGTLDPLGLEPLQQLLLGFDNLLADDLEELVLAVVFHFLEASVPIFLSSISQKLFLERRTSFVVYFEVLTRTWSPFFKENALPPSTER